MGLSLFLSRVSVVVIHWRVYWGIAVASAKQASSYLLVAHRLTNLLLEKEKYSPTAIILVINR